MLTAGLSLSLMVGATEARAERPDPRREALERALAYLETEVPAWPRKQGCFSCHNSGDGARALFVARQQGFPIDETAIIETRAFLGAPSQWHKGEEDEPFKDKKLATIQFAVALQAVVEDDAANAEHLLLEAAELLVKFQGVDGVWKVDQSGFGGSPITYGDALATALSLRVLSAADGQRFRTEIEAARSWLKTLDAKRVVDAAAVLTGLAGAQDAAALGRQSTSLQRIIDSQDKSGGWGLFPDYRPEAFDTAIAVWALAGQTNKSKYVTDAINRGQAYLVANQFEDGSWDETTRPSGAESYAHRVSTTAWASLALLRSAED